MTNFVDAVLAQMGRLTEGEQRAVREEIEGHMEDHALLLEFLQKRDGEGAEHAMAIHLRHAMDEMGLELDRLPAGPG